MAVERRTIRQPSVTLPPIGGYLPAGLRSPVSTGLRRDRTTVFSTHPAGVDPTVAGWARGTGTSRLKA